MDSRLKGEILRDWFISVGIPESYAVLLKTLIVVALILFLAYLANFVTRRLLLVYIRRLIRKSQSKWDDILID